MSDIFCYEKNCIDVKWKKADYPKYIIEVEVNHAGERDIISLDIQSAKRISSLIDSAVQDIDVVNRGGEK